MDADFLKSSVRETKEHQNVRQRLAGLAGKLLHGLQGSRCASDCKAATRDQAKRLQILNLPELNTCTADVLLVFVFEIFVV